MKILNQRELFNLHNGFGNNQEISWEGRKFVVSTTKPTKWSVCAAKTQISLVIRSAWPESLLSTWRRFFLGTHNAHSEDSDKTGQMPKLIWIFAGCTGHIVLSCIGSFVVSRHAAVTSIRELVPGGRGDFVGVKIIRIYHLQLRIYEPHHEKTCLCHMRTTKVQISMSICAVWSAPLLFTA